MSFPLTNYLFFAFSFLAGVTMVVEGCSIVMLKKQITPLPTRILYGLVVVMAGSEKSRQQFSSRTSPKDLHTYALCALVFGVSIFISSFVYLFTTVL